MRLNEFIERCHANARDKGFWDNPSEMGTLIALIHSEVSEAMEAVDNSDQFRVQIYALGLGICAGD